jgi:hypothetical protein
VIFWQNSLNALRRNLKGRLLRPGDQAYSLAMWPNSGRWADVQPLAIAMCAGTHDVQQCVNWGRENDMPFVVRSGGHSYAGFSTTAGLLLVVKGINGVHLDTTTHTATVGGGASNEDVAEALRTTPLAIPSGRCATVGTSGLVLGGGWGFAASRLGLTCDSLLSTEVVLADGSVVTASKASEPELFWAIRGGGGGNFGVHTSFRFSVHEVEQVATFNIRWPARKQVELLSALQKVQRDVPRRISTRSKARPNVKTPNPARGNLIVETLGLFWGSAAELREALAPVFAIAQPELVDIQDRDYWIARDYLLTDDPNGLFALKSSYVESALSVDGLDTMLDWMSSWPGGSVRQDNLGILFAFGGAVNDLAADATAYVHRKSNFLFEMQTMWSPMDSQSTVRRQEEWLAQYFDAMQPYVQPQSYVNFADRSLNNWAQAYYATNLPRLSAAKRAYDPDNIFKFPQSVPLGTSAAAANPSWLLTPDFLSCPL